MKTLTVALPGRSYEIIIERGLLDQAGARCRAALLREAARKPVLLVTHDADDVSGLEARLLRL